MIWSFSNGRMFKKCQRQWYYKKCLANALARDSLRHEAYLLGNLSSIHAWRGKVVDEVIERSIVPALRTQRRITLDDALKAADNLFDTQLAFALAHKVMEPGFKKSEHKLDFAAFFEVEYGKPPSHEDIDKARAEVHKALRNLFTSSQFEELRKVIKSANAIEAQCTLSFRFMGATVRAIPDLICLFRSEPPLIIDWKVHHFGVHDYYQQLVAYAIVLIRSGEHKSLPRAMRNCAPQAVRLYECQLLKDEARQHVVEQQDIDSVEERMAGEICEMLAAVDGLKNSELCPDDFPTTNWPGVCATCNFQKICFEKPKNV
ncbi:MAG TPA: PD-(D/E)XK nuclease family protein [Verrucomicrobiae bacterium]|jgi:hypothetical protein